MMKRSSFWTSTKALWRYRRTIGVAIAGAVVSGACFGAGLGMLMPVFNLLFGGAESGQSLSDMVREALVTPDAAAWRITLADRITATLPADAFEQFMVVMGVIALLTLIGSVGNFTHQYLTVTVVQRTAMDWRGRVFDRLLHSPLADVLARGRSDYFSRIIYDTGILSRGYSAILGKALAESLKGAGALAMALAINWRFSVIVLGAIVPIALVLRHYGKVIRRASKRALATNGRILARLHEAQEGLPVVKAYHAEAQQRRRFRRLNRTLFGQLMRMRRAKALASPLTELLALGAVIVVASIAAFAILRPEGVPGSVLATWVLWAAGGSDPQTFMTVLTALAAAGATLRPLTSLHVEIKEADAAAQRLLDAVSLPVEETRRAALAAGGQAKPALPRHERSVVFEDISFGYPDAAETALEGVSLEVAFGQTVAIVGPNGSGKTTLLSMLPRLLEPTAGRVLIDGGDITEVDLRSLRRQVAVVSQHSILFEGTIAENIALGAGHVQREAIEAAAERAFAHEFIAARAGGYDELLGESGSGLSGGQRQRLCIARAILRDPTILILDEATSQIDAESELKISRALQEVRRGRTTFIIAHRLSTVVDADAIIVMDRGRIVDQGTHEALLERCKLYQTLAKTQLQPSAAGPADDSESQKVDAGHETQ